MRGRVHARRTLKGLVADLRQVRKYKELTVNVRWYEERANYSECISVGNLYWQIELGHYLTNDAITFVNSEISPSTLAFSNAFIYSFLRSTGTTVQL